MVSTYKSISFAKCSGNLSHLFAFMLHDLFNYNQMLYHSFFEFMIRQAADLFSSFLCDMPGLGKYRGKYARQMFLFLSLFFNSLLFWSIFYALADSP